MGIWVLTLWKEHTPYVFQNRIMRKILGSKRDQVQGDWRKPNIEELCNFLSDEILLGGSDQGR
jgi:hypothetical protein